MGFGIKGGDNRPASYRVGSLPALVKDHDVPTARLFPGLEKVCMECAVDLDENPQA